MILNKSLTGLLLRSLTARYEAKAPATPIAGAPLILSFFINLIIVLYL